MIYHNYYFIERISSRLAEILVGAQLIECFSQNKDELIIAFELNHGGRFYIQANLEETTNLLYFPKEYARARKNSVNLFADTLGQRVLTIIKFHLIDPLKYYLKTKVSCSFSYTDEDQT